MILTLNISTGTLHSNNRPCILYRRGVLIVE